MPTVECIDNKMCNINVQEQKEKTSEYDQLGKKKFEQEMLEAYIAFG